MNHDTVILAGNCRISMEKMKDALLKKDYKKFIEFVNPGVFELAGGKDKMMSEIKKTMGEIEKGGGGILDIMVGNPSNFVYKGNEIQCLLKENIILKVDNEKILVTSWLIGISNDGGIKWTYIDTSNFQNEGIRNTFKNLSDELHVPDPVAPVPMDK